MQDLVVCFWFDLCGLVILYRSELTKFKLIITIFKHSFVYLNPTLIINVFSY